MAALDSSRPLNRKSSNKLFDSGPETWNNIGAWIKSYQLLIQAIVGKSPLRFATLYLKISAFFQSG